MKKKRLLRSGLALEKRNETGRVLVRDLLRDLAVRGLGLVKDPDLAIDADLGLVRGNALGPVIEESPARAIENAHAPGTGNEPVPAIGRELAPGTERGPAPPA